jgi:hypothetical protein
VNTRIKQPGSPEATLEEAGLAQRTPQPRHLVTILPANPRLSLVRAFGAIMPDDDKTILPPAEDEEDETEDEPTADEEETPPADAEAGETDPAAAEEARKLSAAPENRTVTPDETRS